MQRPPWKIIGDSSVLVLTTGGEARPEGVRLPPGEAAWLLRQLLGRVPRGDRAPTPLTAAARYVLATHAVRLGVAGGDARATVLAALARGLLVGWRMEQSHRGANAGGDTDAADEQGATEGAFKPRTWIEIALTDMDGNVMPGERYWIKLPDGTVREGVLDAHGCAYFGDLDPGTAEIRWPARDGEATEGSMAPGQAALDNVGGHAASGRSAVERTWVELELLDMADQPVAYERYWIKLPDGTVREGALDALGCAYFDDLDPGQCTIRWLGRDEEAAFLEPDATAPGPTDQVAAQVQALTEAARDGVPFCEECERARRQAEAAA